MLKRTQQVLPGTLYVNLKYQKYDANEMYKSQQQVQQLFEISQNAQPRFTRALGLGCKTRKQND